MIDRLSSRRRAKAFQQALERYESALEQGRDRDAAFREVAATGGADARLFSIATNMGDALAPMPEPRAVEMFAARLRHTEMRSRPRLVRRPKLGLAPLALAACTVLIATVLIPSFQSLPGDRLYALKSSAEDARVWFASGPAEARVRIGLANERFSEVEELLERAELEALAASAGWSGATPSEGGLRGIAASVDDIDDPELAKLIDSTLAEAGEHIETAAKILIAEPATAPELDALVEISKRGRELAAEVVENLPSVSQPPVLHTAVKLAKIEAKAKAARMGAEPTPTPPPCATPTPTPTPEPGSEPQASPDDSSLETATPTAVASPTAEPTATPKATPCVSPSPTPTPTPTPTPEPAPLPNPDGEGEPTAQPEGGSDAQGPPFEVSGSDGDEHGSGGDGADA